jgi:DNA-binding MarR family transcriptional regulator
MAEPSGDTAPQLPQNGPNVVALEPPTGFLLVRIAEAIDRRFTERLRLVGLKPRELHTLRYLSVAAPLSQTELAAGLEVDPANLIDTLDGLEAQGLIRREIDPGDRRRRYVTLTRHGSQRLRAGLKAAETADHDVLGLLDPTRFEQLRSLLLDVYEPIRQPPGDQHS